MPFFKLMNFSGQFQTLRGVQCLLLISDMLSGHGLITRAVAESPRERLSLAANWKFHPGDDWTEALRLDKAGANAGPASASQFGDVSWPTMNLSHDRAIELPF